MNWGEAINEMLDEDEILLECTLSSAQMKHEFDDGYGGIEGEPFTAWSNKYVYFPICYDGAESVGRAPRNPCDEACEHGGDGE